MTQTELTLDRVSKAMSHTNNGLMHAHTLRDSVALTEEERATLVGVCDILFNLYHELQKREKELERQVRKERKASHE